jgi:signal transduction histidine kinase
MNNIKMFIDVFGTLIDVLIIYTFFSAVEGGCKLSKKTIFGVYTGYFIVVSAIVLSFHNSSVLAGLMLLSIIAVSFSYKSNFFTKVFTSTIIVVLIILAEMLTGVIIAAITKVSVEIITSNIFYYLQGVLFSKALLLILVKIVQYRKLSTYSKVSKTLFVPIFALPISTVLIIYVVSKYAYSLVDTASVAWVAVSVVLLVSSNILVFYLFEKQLMQDEETKKSTLIQQQLQYQTQYFKELSDKYKLSNKTVHDTKNQLFAISAAISDNNVDMAKSKIDELCKNAAGGENSIRTGNDALDALINTKYNNNKELNIKFKHNIVIHSKNQIDNIDLCIIVGNALDNAIEACSKIDRNTEKEIVLKIRQVKEYLAIEMTNPTSENIEKVNGRLVSGKKEKELHGFGMQSMEEIVNKYNGNLSYSQNNGLFSLKIYVQN